MNIKQISQATGIDETNILSLNPSLRRHFVPTLSQGFQLVLPLRVIEKFNHFLMDLEIPPLVFEYRSLEVEVTSELSIFEIGQSLNVDPYLLKHWNHLSGDYVRKGQKLLVHELFDPNIKELRKNPNPRVEPLLQLPKTSTLQDHFSNLLQVYRRRELERQNWDVHHLLVSL